ncbi:uncharacterized protein [Littorina saxatilis]|uniref:uncharacterized protein n=1 Tax=Littorina saxatilis TaxID=31220 RepID=UPI0038B50145
MSRQWTCVETIVRSIGSPFLTQHECCDGKTHNMDALDDKFDRHVSFLLQEFEGQSFPSTLPRTCEESNIITSLLQEWKPDKQVELQYEIIACVRVLDVLGIEVVTRETLRACLNVCTCESWRRAFLSGRLQKATEFLLHIASIESLPRGFMYSRGNGVCNETALSLLVPQIQNKNMIVCFLKIAKSTLNKEQICLISKLLHVEADSSFKQCMNRALRDGEWGVVDHMLRLYDMDTTTLHQVLVKAMERRKWKEVEACLERGADIATACTETGFDLNARSGERNRTVLHDAISNHKDTKEIVQALLQAGADPNVRDSDGETAVCTAVNYRNWDFALLLLMHSRAAGTTVSHTFRNGEPVLHFVCKKGQSDLVRELFTTQTDPLATDGKGNTLIMAALGGADSKNVRRDYSRKPEPITPGSEKENVMRVLIQSGVATHQALLSQSQLRSLKQEAQNVTVDSFQSPMWQAVKTRKLRIARMQYAAGACCHEEIHELVNSEFIGHKLEETNQRDTLKFSEDFFSHFHARFDYEPDDASACCHTEIHELANSEYVRQKVIHLRNYSDPFLARRDITFFVENDVKHQIKKDPFLAFLNDIFSHVRSQGVHYTVGQCCTQKHNARGDAELKFVREKTEEMKNWCDIMDFLDHISSHPRSLRDICALTISHLIGCGPQRDERAASLGLPDSLRRRVLQDHVISSDFLKDYPPDPEDREPYRLLIGMCGNSSLGFGFCEPICSCKIEEGE